MIGQLRLRNFKAFERLALPFGSLTLLSGMNGSGKSSVMQSLLLLRQSSRLGPGNRKQIDSLRLQGDLFSAGLANDIYHEYGHEAYTEIGLDLVGRDGVTIRFAYDAPGQSTFMKAMDGPAECPEESLFTDRFQYLHAERAGPRVTFQTGDLEGGGQIWLGKSGEFAAHYLAEFGDKTITAEGVRHPAARGSNLLSQVEAWGGEICAGLGIALDYQRAVDQVAVRYNMSVGLDLQRTYRPTNVAFGITYTLPILVGVLAAQPGDLLLIENPEAHLHPRAQSKMGQLLGLAAQCGIQILAETHSDHVLNGIRLLAKAGKLQPESVRLHFFEREIGKDFIRSKVVSPELDSDGRLSVWPAGFFDEWERSLDQLLGFE